MKELNWDSQSTKKHCKEATEANLTLLGLGKRYLSNGKLDMHYRRYKSNDCGHEQDIQITQVRRNGAMCNICISFKHEQEAEEVGLKLIGKGKTKDYRKYKFLSCGHEQEIRLDSVRNDSFECKTCFINELKIKIKPLGLKYIESLNGRKHRFKINKCGHYLDVIPASLFRRNQKSVNCKHCFEEQLKIDALNRNLKILDKGKTSKHYIYLIQECGHEQEIRYDHAANGSFICHKCEITHSKLPSKVYLLELNNGVFKWLKFGFGKSVKARIERYTLVKNTKIKKIKVINFNSGLKAMNFEQSIHKKYKHKKITKKKMMKYMKQGFTECYPIEMKNILHKELTSLDNK